ncbi:hypothetical protein A2V68_03180 [candidate division Kazan bacterium RBG_13_50_9]|uniref:HTH HARE-type domain-containing protein n=1 Tax=candidate division Kazan bacterium RBG_13_50_9 TaxID=1798535 RepID=A0A1F4NSU1_UNCK3|nr:MAG: hypothetical protein A2V68_03180 [candidate division Kazan bacterium RBG_13_50_9]
MDSQNYQQPDKSQPEESVLGKVLSENQSRELLALRPSKVVGNVLSRLRDRERDVLTSRYGLQSGSPRKETLESIGQRLSVTRERVRQIEKAALKKISKQTPSIRPLWKIIEEYFTAHGGVIGLDHLVRYLQLDENGDAERECNALRLAMAAYPGVQALRKHPAFKEGWVETSVSEDQLLKIQTAAQRILEKRNQPMAEAGLMALLVDEISEAGPALLKGALQVGAGLGIDSHGQWGLVRWPVVVPRRIRDKVFLVLEEVKRPLHFEEIAKLIQQKFKSKKPVLSRTVHNELIGDKRFVLVGRGIYALKDWGYRPGVVADVIKEILRKAGKPLHISEIIEEVMKLRQVKRNTVVANLQDRTLFKKVGKAVYGLVPHDEAGETSS